MFTRQIWWENVGIRLESERNLLNFHWYPLRPRFLRLSTFFPLIFDLMLLNVAKCKNKNKLLRCNQQCFTAFCRIIMCSRSICPSFSPNECTFVWMCCVYNNYENFLSTVPIVWSQLPFPLNIKKWPTHKHEKEAVCQCTIVAFCRQLHATCERIERIHFATRVCVICNEIKYRAREPQTIEK